jgi:hypothetical protein
MTFDLRLSQDWEDQSRYVKSLLGISEAQAQVGLYHGIGHALLDLLYGIKEFWPLKKTLVVVGDGDPYLLSCLRTFVRESYQVIRKNSWELGNIAEWVNELKSDVLAVVYSSDHAFTGEVLLVQELSERLAAKKIYSIEIQHTLHAYSKKTVFPWHIQVQHFFPDLAVVIQGARIRLFQHSAPLIEWYHRDLGQELNKWRDLHKENRESVKKFEAHFNGVNQENSWNIRTYFDVSHDFRLWDRSIIFIDDVGGDHFIHRLAEKLNMTISYPGFSEFLETTHLCRWRVAKEYNWWGKEDLTPDDLRSLVAISVHILEQPNFFNQFTEVLSACHKDVELL